MSQANLAWRGPRRYGCAGAWAPRVRQLGYWKIYPLVFPVYTLIRGAIVGFYPYPFLNPASAGGYGGVALYCVAIFVAFLVVGWLLVVAANRWKGVRASLAACAERWGDGLACIGRTRRTGRTGRSAPPVSGLTDGRARPFAGAIQ